MQCKHKVSYISTHGQITVGSASLRNKKTISEIAREKIKKLSLLK
jgi:hypothetical protein